MVYRQWHVPAGLAGIYAGAVFPSIGGRPTFFWTGHEVAALVVDLGSCMLKASFAGDDATGAVFSSIGGKPEMLASWPGLTRRTAYSLWVWVCMHAEFLVQQQ